MNFWTATFLFFFFCAAASQSDYAPAYVYFPNGPQGGGAIYTRWGKSTCPQIPGTELVYSGITGGNFYNTQGGGANRLCMPMDAEYSSTLTYADGVQGQARIYGSEYQKPLQGEHDGVAVCAVCYVPTRSTVYMIPAKASCPETWTREYYGYLMTERNSHRRSMYDCVDAEQEHLPGTNEQNLDGVLFYHVEADCGNLPCPPYNDHQEVNCVVCTK